MTPTSDRTGPGRPRDPELTPRVLAAALAEYGHTGWAAFTFDAVARRAGVGKAALYRRWPTKHGLLADAIEAHTQPLVAADTGSLRGDTQALAVALLEHYLDPAGWVPLRIVVDAATEPERFAPHHDRIVAVHRGRAERVIRRAVERGELPQDVLGQAFIEALYGAILVHALAMPHDRHEEARRHAADHVAPLVEFVLASINAQTARPG